MLSVAYERNPPNLALTLPNEGFLIFNTNIERCFSSFTKQFTFKFFLISPAEFFLHTSVMLTWQNKIALHVITFSDQNDGNCKKFQNNFLILIRSKGVKTILLTLSPIAVNSTQSPPPLPLPLRYIPGKLKIGLGVFYFRYEHYLKKSRHHDVHPGQVVKILRRKSRQCAFGGFKNDTTILTIMKAK